MFRIPPITKNLLLINILLYIASGLLERNGIDLNDLLGLHFFMADSFWFYQLLTYMFLHANFEHIFFNMLAFWMFGRILEQAWGPKRYLIFYLVCGIGAGICQEVVQYIEYAHEGLAKYDMVSNGGQNIPMAQYLNLWTTVGASGAVYGILLGFGMTFPNERILLLIPPMPIKAKYLVIGYAVIELFSGLNTNSNVAHFAHLGGMLFGLVLILLWRKKARRNNGFDSWKQYEPKKESFWQRTMRMAKEQAEAKQRAKESSKQTPPPPPEQDEMTLRRARQAEIDRILDKVKTSGYASLTEQEKKTIFDFRNQ